jgi:hypothetical protein
MVPHERENPTFSYTFSKERDALRSTKALRGIPEKSANKLLAATWNLTNFGEQHRTLNDFKLMAEIISWFDLIAIQEVSDDLDHLRKLMKHLPGYHVIMSDVGGNDERAGFLYNPFKVQRLELAAEVAVPPSDQKYIRMKGVSGSFNGFDRNPYAVAFKAGTLEFMAVSVHLFFGSNSYFNVDRRALEAFALSKWAKNRHQAPGAYSQNILCMGDYNLPKRDEKDNVFRALVENDFILPEHSTAMGSNLQGDKHYDQVAFHSGGMKDAYTGNSGVFDFDHEPLFKSAWSKGKEYFDTTVKYHLADHRPLWIEFNL